MAESPNIEILNELAEYLQRHIRVKQTVIGWPDGAQKLSLPAMSLHVKRAREVSYPPHMILAANIENNTADTSYLVGEFEFTIQLDLWCKTSAERYDALEKVRQIFHSQHDVPVPILNLPLAKYHKTMATYTMTGNSIPDSSATPLTQEWRVMVDILASCSQIATRENEKIITQDPDVSLEILK